MRTGRRGGRIRAEGTRRRAAAVLLASMLLPALLAGAGYRTQRGKAPLAGTEWYVSDWYGERTDPFTGQKAFHNGMDLACTAGTGVLAVQQGIVLAAAYSESYGNYLRLLHPDQSETRYAHLQYLYVRPGEVVQAGQTLGTVGQTGRATGPHLHLELWEQGKACDPAVLLEDMA